MYATLVCMNIINDLTWKKWALSTYFNTSSRFWPAPANRVRTHAHVLILIDATFFLKSLSFDWAAYSEGKYIAYVYTYNTIEEVNF